jgi:hypothetical protein
LLALLLLSMLFSRVELFDCRSGVLLYAAQGYFCPTPANVKSAARGGTSWTETPYTCQGAMSG